MGMHKKAASELERTLAATRGIVPDLRTGKLENTARIQRVNKKGRQAVRHLTA